MNIGVIGCGNISGAYFNGAQKLFGDTIRIVAGADLNRAALEAKAKEWNFKPMSVEELLASPEVEIVLNLTTPQSHTDLDLRALEAGKHVYAEKPFGLTRESGAKVLRTAATKKLRVGSAPDTFLGGGHQTCRKLIDDGVIGKVVSGTAFMLCHGHESWHPAPGFYYQKGGGPLFDMGPYYLTCLINLLGPVKKVVAINNRAFDCREGIKVNHGKTFPVEVDTHIAGVLEFVSGAVITLITSFDVWKHSDYRDIELHGTRGSLHVPDPNGFGGEIRLFQAGLSADWMKVDNFFGYNDNSRSIGLADMARAITDKRPHRASGELAFHVLDVMCALEQASAEERAIPLQSSCERPAPLPLGLKMGQLD